MFRYLWRPADDLYSQEYAAVRVSLTLAHRRNAACPRKWIAHVRAPWLLHGTPFLLSELWLFLLSPFCDVHWPCASLTSSIGVCGGAHIYDNATVPNCCLPAQRDCQGACQHMSPHSILAVLSLCHFSILCYHCLCCRVGVCSGGRVLDNSTIPQCCLPSERDCQGTVLYTVSVAHGFTSAIG